MSERAVRRTRLAPSAAASAVSALLVMEVDRDAPLVSIPRPEMQLVVRFGAAPRGLDLHVMGARQRAHRKTLRAGQRAVTARLHLGATRAVFGVSASEIAGRIVALEDLWGEPATRPLIDQLAATRSPREAAAVMERAIAERMTRAEDARRSLVTDAAQRLASESVSAVAAALGVSERHLRRVFHESVGMSPKAFARVVRFRRALRAAREGAVANWASIAASAGYYDQAHLIDEFRAIAGATPRALLGELA
ncbi:MAG: helix-turn-helix domain-containing protein [Polyangiales bacterium]